MSTEFEHWHHDSHDQEALDREQREHGPAWPGFGRLLVRAYVMAALIGLALGVIWVIAGLLHFHPLW
jgi:hypothetical protein